MAEALATFLRNSAKRNKSLEEFLKWVETVYRYRGLPCQ